VLALDSAADYLIELLELPVANVLAGDGKADLHAPGSLLRMEVETGHPMARGLRALEAGYFASSPAFQDTLRGPVRTPPIGMPSPRGTSATTYSRRPGSGTLQTSIECGKRYHGMT